MGETEVKITHETIYEIYRREKDLVELQELPAAFLSDVDSYLIEKQSALVAHSQAGMFAEAAQRTRIQIENTRKLLREIFDRRESKIINMAMMKARTGSIINLHPLLVHEKDLYTSVLGVLNMHRARGEIGTHRVQDENVTVTATPLPLPAQAIPSLISPTSRIFDASPAPITPLPVVSAQSLPYATPPAMASSPPPMSTIFAPRPGASGSRVKFLCAVPKFVGPNLEVYGPFSEHDTCLLPPQIVQVLTAKGRAVIVEDGQIT